MTIVPCNERARQQLAKLDNLEQRCYDGGFLYREDFWGAPLWSPYQVIIWNTPLVALKAPAGNRVKLAKEVKPLCDLQKVPTGR